MAVETKCQTPGTRFKTVVDPLYITVEAWLPTALDLSEEEAALLEANIHNAMELVLAPYFRDK